MSVIKIKNLTKDYKLNRGIFNLNIDVAQGETVGFVGTNGAGKTTTIRHIMGFIKQDEGEVFVNNMDAWKDSYKIKQLVGYVPGEISFPDEKTGVHFLKRQMEMLNAKNMDYANEMIEKLQLDPTANLKRMSKGMKQKTAIVAALMHDPKILVLDEPTTGLDPLMRRAFIDLIKKEKKKGKTIFMSSHHFEEIEEVCDKVILLKEGKIISIANMKEIKHNPNKVFVIEFLNNKDYQSFIKLEFEYIQKRSEKNRVRIKIHDTKINTLLLELAKYKLKYFKEIKYTLDDYFKGVYKEDNNG